MKTLVLLTICLFSSISAFTQLKVKTYYSQELDHGWHFREAGNGSWMIAKVPGCVHTDLYFNDKIDDPFVAGSVEKLKWIELKDWEYECTIPDVNILLNYDHVELNFEGLDTYADVYVNDEIVLSTDNMFAAFRVDIRRKLYRDIPNKLRIVFHSPVNHDMPLALASDIKYPADNEASIVKTSPFTRKAAYQFGWDFAPRYVTSGIWRNVKLEAWNGVRLRDVHFKTISITKDAAVIEANLEIESDFQGDAQIIIKDAGKSFKPLKIISPLMRKTYNLKIPFTIKRPDLWYQAGLGKQNLYTFYVNVICDTVVEEVTVRNGIRTLEVVNEKDANGESFFLKVNGRPLYAKGANYVPDDIFPTSVTSNRYDRLFDDMIESNFNMIRVWGGGIYESDYFYDKADEKGILIWQDFMFSCTMYPSDTLFMRKVADEVTYNVKRLRNHASLAMWCGNNEIEVGWKNWGWQKAYNYSAEQIKQLEKGYKELFKEFIPGTLNRLDSGRFYMPSSPISNWGRKEDFAVGDNHYWGVWHGEKPFESYRQFVPRFTSEFGFQSYPSVNAQRLMVGTENTSAGLSDFQKAGKGDERIAMYMAMYYKVPETNSMKTYISQLLQADAMRIAIEAQRKSKPYCMGSLYWQFNDCWPAVSWSTTDFFGGRKAAFYAVKRAFKELLVSTEVENDSIKITVISDEPEERKTNLNLKLYDFSGNTLWKEKIAITIPAANEKCITYYSNSVKGLLKNYSRDSVYLKANIDKKSEEAGASICYFNSMKNITFPNVDVKYEINKSDGSYLVELKTETLAKNVYMSVDGDVSAVFEENFFDMPAGSERKIKFSSSFELKDVAARFKIITLSDTYATGK